ncbi:MAG: Hpt domain-containing protein [Firmicutes bacterium]|nr:Hpt domain-containing protein [Bacillota bacterium]
MTTNILNKLKEAGIYAEEGISRLMNNEEIYLKYLKKFAAGDEYYNQLVAAFNINDCKAAFKAAHTLRGNVGNLAINTMYAILVEMTEALRIGDIDNQHEALRDLIKAHDKACETISKVLG